MYILTGASGGIGQAIIPSLIERGNVFGIYNSHKPKIQSSKKLTFKKIDLRDTNQIQKCVEKIESRHKKVTLLHFAAISIDGLVVSYSDENWDEVHSINLKGNFALTRALLPRMIQNQWGRIIHVSSILGAKGGRGVAAYASSKMGLVGLSNVLSKEYGRFGITSNVLNLGYFDVGLINKVIEQKRNSILSDIPVGKFGSISNIINAIDFLVQSEYVNGAVIDIDGGL